MRVKVASSRIVVGAVDRSLEHETASTSGRWRDPNAGGAGAMADALRRDGGAHEDRYRANAWWKLFYMESRAD